MNKYELALICDILLISISLGVNDDVQGYYWRDYLGNLPHDAVPGGQESGKTTYIGQSLYKDQIIPSKIVPDAKVAYFEWGFSVFNTSGSVKALCTNHPEYLHWIKTDTQSFGKITDKHFIIAGFEAGGTLHVGRGKTENDVILGKLLFNKDGAVLHSEYRGQSIMHWEFEALYFDPSNAGTKPNKPNAAAPPTCKCKDKAVHINLFC